MGCWKRACPASTRPATSAQARSSAAPPRSVRARWSFASSTSTCPACPRDSVRNRAREVLGLLNPACDVVFAGHLAHKVLLLVDLGQLGREVLRVAVGELDDRVDA